MIVDVGTRYVVETREPHLGEWIMYPGPIYTMVTDRHDVALQQACTVLIGTLTIGLDENGSLRYNVVPMPTWKDGYSYPEQEPTVP